MFFVFVKYSKNKRFILLFHLDISPLDCVKMICLYIIRILVEVQEMFFVDTIVGTVRIQDPIVSGESQYRLLKNLPEQMSWETVNCIELS